MARKIKETPLLKGNNAKKFLSDINNIKKVDKSTLKRMLENYEKINAIIVV